jgi:glycosyltransferase involved in cell wall biosynthesis
MKVLWFSNTPANGEEILGNSVIRGGWLKSLDRAISDKVELHVAFDYPKYFEPFEHAGVHYYPICKKNWKLEIVKKLLSGDYVDERDLPVYLSIIKAASPDIIHIHGSENPFGCIIGQTVVPIVLSIQGSQTVILHKYFSGIEKKYLTGRQFDTSSLIALVFEKSFKSAYREYKKAQQRELRNIKKCTYFIGRTDWDRRLSSVLVPGSKYFHNDEVLRDGFYAGMWNKAPVKKITIQSTIGINLFKGLETLCEALFELNAIGVNVEWRVAGISINDVIVKIVKRKLGNRFPLRGLILQGNLNEENLIINLLEADLYVTPSHIENSPNNLCEAMILGLPCIATFVGGTGSLLKDKVEGILIQDGDPWSMAGGILELINNPDIAREYGAKARIRALKRHNKNNIVLELINIYSSVINENINS